VTIAAEKGTDKIAVEVASFLNPSPVRDLQETVGQYQIYRILLAELQPERNLFLAVPRGAYETILAELLGQLVVERLQLRLLVFDSESEKVVKWIK
jgi:hypothetical protein